MLTPAASPVAAEPIPVPFARCSLRSIRLLVGFTLVADEAADARRILLCTLGLGSADPCAALFRLTAAARVSPAVAWSLDAALAVTLDGRGEGLRSASVAALADSWRERGGAIRGAQLAALVWRLARDPRPCVRPLEREIVRGLEPEDLVSDAPFQCARPLGEPRERRQGARAVR